MIELVILSDDLSGAADCAISSAAAGFSTTVLLRPQLQACQANVIAIDLDSRRRSQLSAGLLHRETVDQVLKHWPLAIVYKKIDSTLRGHIAAEVTACLMSMPQRPMAIVAPAFPATGRTTRNGRTYLSGKPLETTEVWFRDHGRADAELTQILSRAGLRVELSNLAEVRCGRRLLQARFGQLLAEGAQAVVCDAESDEDLSIVASAAMRLVPRPLLVGSAGLARQLPECLQQNHSTPPRPRDPRPCGSPKPILTVVGSMSAVSQAQARRLATSPAAPHTVHVAKDVLAGSNPSRLRMLKRDLTKAFAERADVLVLIEHNAVSDAQPRPEFAVALAHLVCPYTNAVGGMILTGGDTARAMLEAMGVAALRMVSELEPGVALGITTCSRALRVVTKAGAFGDIETLVRAQAVLRYGSRTGAGE